jgi:hypothetical protein
VVPLAWALAPMATLLSVPTLATLLAAPMATPPFEVTIALLPRTTA